MTTQASITIRQFAIEITAKLALTLGVLGIAWGAGANAQSRPKHTENVAQVKAADIVRDPADLPPPIGDRPPALVKVTLTSKEIVGALDPA
ncbi:MAG TPA: hypothetical protein VGS58_18620, partial [Candidatus Sulfopaludibacter sp.]|nr:hypothetical protein [Candidatus Sulfopaludibacter sp.]